MTIKEFGERIVVFHRYRPELAQTLESLNYDGHKYIALVEKDDDLMDSAEKPIVVKFSKRKHFEMFMRVLATAKATGISVRYHSFANAVTKYIVTHLF